MTPGLPFADSNLKLAVLSELQSNGTIQLGTPEQLAEQVLQRSVDLESEGYEFNQPVYDFLARYPLARSQLDAVTELTLDGGSEIYRYVWYHWDGESDEFDIHSFDGIEALRNLKTVNYISMVAPEAVPVVAALESSLKGGPVSRFFKRLLSK